MLTYVGAGDHASSGPTPGIEAWEAYVSNRWPGGVDLGTWNVRNVRGGSTLSVHAVGRAWDWRYANPGPGRAAAEEAMAFTIDHHELLGVQAIHDYVACRIWRCSRGGSGPAWKQQKPGNGMGAAWAAWLHFEVHPDSPLHQFSVDDVLNGAGVGDRPNPFRHLGRRPPAADAAPARPRTAGRAPPAGAVVLAVLPFEGRRRLRISDQGGRRGLAASAPALELRPPRRRLRTTDPRRGGGLVRRPPTPPGRVRRTHGAGPRRGGAVRSRPHREDAVDHRHVADRVGSAGSERRCRPAPPRRTRRPARRTGRPSAPR